MTMNPKDTFDGITDLYHTTRPGYPQILIEKIAVYSGLHRGSHVLEVGPGSGQATESLVTYSPIITCVEPGKLMVKKLSDRFSGRQKLKIHNMYFEDFEGEPGFFDLALSATAFHWVKEDIGYPKLQRLLKPGGAVALLWHDYRVEGDTSIDRAIKTVYDRYLEDTRQAESIRAKHKSDDNVSEKWLKDSGLFYDYEFHQAVKTHIYSAEQYARLTETHSVHQLFSPARLKSFSAELANVINNAGGSYHKVIRTVLYLARAKK